MEYIEGQDFAIERRAHVRVCGVAESEHPADIENLNRVADLELARQAARVAAQRIPKSQRTDDDVALRQRGHASRGQLELVVPRFVVQDAHGDQYAFLAGYVGGQPEFGAELGVLRHRRDLVSEDCLHAAAPPARVCSEPVRDRIRA